MTSTNHSARRLFDYSLIVATLAPTFFILVQKAGFQTAGALVGLVSALSATHVFATTYLFSDGHVRQFVSDEPVKLIAVPIALIAVSVVILLLLPLWIALLFALIYVHWQAYHYGQQNLGVAAFSSLGARGTGISAFERTTIRLGVLCGVLGSYKALWPHLGLGTSHFKFDLAIADTIFFPLFWIGMALSIALVAAAAYHAVINLRQWPRYALLYFVSVAFFLPIYLSNDILIAFVSYAVAHGLQYLVFLGFHAGGRSVSRATLILATAALLVAIASGYAIWNHIGSVVALAWDKEQTVRIVAGMLWGLTIAHFWFDQSLWKLRVPSRRDWMRERYAFLFSPSH